MLSRWTARCSWVGGTRVAGWASCDCTLIVAHLVNVHVLGENGFGLTSNVLAGTDWVIANRARDGIRVVNLSLGTSITAPCPLDPMCSSVLRLVQMSAGAGSVNFWAARKSAGNSSV